MDAAVVTSTPDAFDAAVESASTYVAPTAAVSTDTELEDTGASARDEKGRFASSKSGAVDDGADPSSPPAGESEAGTKAAEQKPAGKPRNDPQARIDQIVKEREDAKREAARYKAELDAARAPREQPKPAAIDAPDPTDATKYPGGEYDPKFLKDQARYEAKQEFREQQESAAKEAEDTRKAREFDTRAQAFVTRLKDANAVEAIDRRLLSGKPLSLLTSKERAEIAKLPAAEQSELGFICFLADQWNDSEHDVELVKYLSDPQTFQRLATLPPHQVMRELARVEAGFGAAAPNERGPAPKPSASQAKPPIKPLGTTPHVVADDDGSDDESIEKHFARENARDRKSGRL